MRCDTLSYVDESKGPRTTIAVRVSEAGLRVLDDIAADEGRTRSDVIRRLLDEAVKARKRKAGKP